MNKNELRNHKRMLRQLPRVEAPHAAALRRAFQDATIAADVRAHRVLSMTTAELYGLPTWSGSRVK